MQKSSLLHYLLPILLTLPLLLAGCNSASSGAPQAIESYLESLAAKDQNQMIFQSCAEWEAEARLEYDSFAAVEVTLEELECQESALEGDYTLVSCTGRIVASYGAEDLVIELPERTFKAIQQGGEWRMCGYQ